MFVPAGTLEYMGAWLFMALLFIPMFVVGAALFFKAPGLLEKRLDSKEKQGAQKRVVGMAAFTFIKGFIVAGLDYRFEISRVPFPIVITASVLLLVSYGLYAEVMRENAYLSRTVKVHEGQKVVDTGLYGIIRHPMYGATVIMFLSIPVVLGSWWSFICFLPYVVIIAHRISNEEKVLEAELDGYVEYKQKVKYKLIPFIW